MTGNAGTPESINIMDGNAEAQRLPNSVNRMNGEAGIRIKSALHLDFSVDGTEASSL